jgi:hypothetical protein
MCWILILVDYVMQVESRLCLILFERFNTFDSECIVLDNALSLNSANAAHLYRVLVSLSVEQLLMSHSKV